MEIGSVVEVVSGRSCRRSLEERERARRDTPNVPTFLSLARTDINLNIMSRGYRSSYTRVVRVLQLSPMYPAKQLHSPVV